MNAPQLAVGIFTGSNMEITYDKDADSMYIEFRKGEFVKNKKMDDFTIMDLDENGNILGIELLEVSKRIPLESLSEVSVKIHRIFHRSRTGGEKCHQSRGKFWESKGKRPSEASMPPVFDRWCRFPF